MINKLDVSENDLKIFCQNKHLSGNSIDKYVTFPLLLKILLDLRANY